MTQVKRASFLSYKYSPLQLSEIAAYRYDCISKYKELTEKEGENSTKAINFLGISPNYLTPMNYYYKLKEKVA